MRERIQRAIARTGFVSRRKAEELIRQRRLKINGTIVTRLGTTVDMVYDSIQIDDAILQPAESKVYILLHKPAGFICTVNDPQKRPTILSLIKNVRERIYPVGRLDLDTEGLIILTNDGSFAQTLQHPSSNIPRTYEVKVQGVPTKRSLAALESGVEMDSRMVYAKNVRMKKKTNKNCWIELSLYEGRNRQIKRMLAAIGHSTLRIIRTGFGPLRLDKLPQGTYRNLKRSEIDKILKIKIKNHSSK